MLRALNADKVSGSLVKYVRFDCKLYIVVICLRCGVFHV
jgi:hypothetical protein